MNRERLIFGILIIILSSSLITGEQDIPFSSNEGKIEQLKTGSQTIEHNTEMEKKQEEFTDAIIIDKMTSIDRSIASISAIEHSVISITKNTDFEDYNFEGTGVSGDPYRIENLNITSINSTAIYIADTTAHFTIINCYIQIANEHFGIYLGNIGSGTAEIVNNTIIRLNASNVAYGGFAMSSTVRFTLINNTFIDTHIDFLRDYLPEYGTSGGFRTAVVQGNTINGKKIGWYSFHDNFVLNEPNYAQIFLVECSNVVISNQNISNVGTAINIKWGNNITIENSQLVNNRCGVFSSSTTHLKVSNNIIRYSHPEILHDYREFTVFPTGINIWRNDYAIVVNNQFTENFRVYDSVNNIYYYIVIPIMNRYSDYSTISFNLFENYYYNLISRSDSTKISDNTFVKGGQSLNIFESHEIEILNNNFRDNRQKWPFLALRDHAIGIEDSDKAKIEDNTINNFTVGILLQRAHEVQISQNTIRNTAEVALEVFLSMDVYVNSNKLMRGGLGMNIHASFDSVFSNNEIMEMVEAGMELESCYNCLIIENVFSRNHNYGVILKETSRTNTIYHNCFINSFGETSQAYDSGESNTWYNSTLKEGNYYSDWRGRGNYLIDGDAETEDIHPLRSCLLLVEEDTFSLGGTTIPLVMIFILSAMLKSFGKENRKLRG